MEPRDAVSRIVLRVSSSGELTGEGSYYTHYTPGSEALMFERTSEHVLSWSTVPPEWLDLLIRRLLGIPAIE